MSDYILEHIKTLTAKPKKPKLLLNYAISNLSKRLKEAMSFEEFYEIDKEIMEQIITKTEETEKVTVSNEMKNEIFQKISEKDSKIENGNKNGDNDKTTNISPDSIQKKVEVYPTRTNNVNHESKLKQDQKTEEGIHDNQIIDVYNDNQPNFPEEKPPMSKPDELAQNVITNALVSFNNNNDNVDNVYNAHQHVNNYQSLNNYQLAINNQPLNEEDDDEKEKEEEEEEEEEYKDEKEKEEYNDEKEKEEYKDEKEKEEYKDEKEKEEYKDEKEKEEYNDEKEKEKDEDNDEKEKDEEDDDEKEKDDDDDEDQPNNNYPIQLMPPSIILCSACNKEIDIELAYFNELPYHIKCVKCIKCTDQQNLEQDLEKLICITPGCFFCPEHYEEYLSNKELDAKYQEEYHKKNKENFIKELFEAPLYIEENIYNNPDEDIFITSDIVQSSIPKNRPFEDFIPTVTFTFDKSPLEIDFDQLAILLGDDVVILSVDHGCTILKIAFLSIKKLSQKVIDKFKDLVNNFKAKLSSTIGKSVIGNLVDEPLITLPNDSDIQKKYNEKASVNLLQNTSELSSIDIETMKEEVLGTLHKEKVKKNWQFLFEHEDIFKMAEKQIREDLNKNEFEMIIIGQTVIANKNIDEYEKLKKRIASGDLKISLFYHGSKLSNHQKIVKKHFLMPGQDKMSSKTDDGYYGKGIYATENMFYASKYANGYYDLEYNKKAHVMCCLSIYNSKKVKELKDMSCYGKKIEPDIANNYGVHHALVGSSCGFYPILESQKESNWIWAEEYVFPNKFQIFPICSITLMRKEFYILWKDENIENNENSNYLDELSKKIEINVYSKRKVEDAIEIIRNKRKNKVKLITNGGSGLTGKKLIEEARKIIGSNFVCLVFAQSENHLKWISQMKNVLFTTIPADFRKFAAMDFNKKDVLAFANGLKYHDRFQIDEKELLSFPTTLRPAGS